MLNLVAESHHSNHSELISFVGQKPALALRTFE